MHRFYYGGVIVNNDQSSKTKDKYQVEVFFDNSSTLTDLIKELIIQENKTDLFFDFHKEEL